MFIISKDISISEGEIKFSFIKSSGPGGQNINKLSTGVQLRFDVAGSQNLTESIKLKLLKNAGKRATSGGEIIIEAKRFRTQDKNKKDALDRLIKLIHTATVIKKKRIKTKRTLKAVEDRINSKKKRSQVKKLRRSVTKNFE